MEFKLFSKYIFVFFSSDKKSWVGKVQQSEQVKKITKSETKLLVNYRFGLVSLANIKLREFWTFSWFLAVCFRNASISAFSRSKSSFLTYWKKSNIGMEGVVEWLTEEYSTSPKTTTITWTSREGISTYGMITGN